MRKINIHLALDETGYGYCLEVNSGVRRITDSVIVFGDGSPMVPHVSVLMGTASEDVIDEISGVVRETVRAVKPFSIKVRPPYLEDARGRYVFSDVEGGGELNDLVNALRQRLEHNYVQSQTDYSSQPHLTLAHVESRREEVREYLTSVSADLVIVVPAVGIADVGPKGTCVNVLHRFELG